MEVSKSLEPFINPTFSVRNKRPISKYIMFSIETFSIERVILYANLKQKECKIYNKNLKTIKYGLAIISVIRTSDAI